MAIQSYGAIVISAAGIHMRVYEVSKKIGIRQIDELSHHMQLGQEIYHDGRFSFESVNEITAVIKDYQLKVAELAVENLQIYMSHSLKEAFNVDFVMTQIRLSTGLKVKLLNNSKEHYLALRSIAYTMPNFDDIIQKGTLIIGVGYGDLQLTYYNQGNCVSTTSVPLGLSRIRSVVEEFGPSTSEDVELMMELIDREVDDYGRRLLTQKIHNIIVEGNELSYLAPNQRQATYSKADIKDIRRQLLTQSQSTHHYLLMAAFAIMDQLVENSKAELVYMPESHICDGAVSDYAYKKLKIFTGHHFSQDRLNVARETAIRFGCDTLHNEYVLQASRKLFKAVSKVYSLNNKDQQVIELASILYDCGKYINMHDDNASDYHIVMASEFVNLSEVNQALVANVLRYASKDFPMQESLEDHIIHGDFYVIFAKITALFRLALALDYTYAEKMEDVNATIKGNELVVTCTCKEDFRIEAKRFEKQAAFFQEVFGLKPVLKCRRKVG